MAYRCWGDPKRMADCPLVKKVVSV
jgi:hypothetical protein